jgi:hypothetical protein
VAAAKAAAIEAHLDSNVIDPTAAAEWRSREIARAARAAARTPEPKPKSREGRSDWKGDTAVRAANLALAAEARVAKLTWGATSLQFRVYPRAIEMTSGVPGRQQKDWAARAARQARAMAIGASNNARATIEMAERAIAGGWIDVRSRAQAAIRAAEAAERAWEAANKLDGF